MSSLVDLEIRRQRLLAERERLVAKYEAGELTVLTQIREINQELAAVVTEIENIRAINSSGTIVRDDQAAETSRANPVNPQGQPLIEENGRVRPAPETTSGSNARKEPYRVVITLEDLPVGPDGGQVRTTTETQSTPPGSSQTSPGPIRSPGTAGTGGVTPGGGTFPGLIGDRPIPGGSPGVGARSDDAGASNVSTTADVVSAINAINFSDKIEAQDNVLNQYSSYTYAASLYLMDQTEYAAMVNRGQRSTAIPKSRLLVQSGGAALDGSRNTYFDLDYYIDDIELKSFILGLGTRLAHNVKEVKFTVIEPNGISFLEKLDSAVQEFARQAPSNANKNKRAWTSAIYLLVIRFYGYDQQGNLVRGGNNGINQGSDPNAFVEKFYPLVITRVNFKIQNKIVEYNIEAKAPPFLINNGQDRATIPFNIELSGQTLKDLLAGPAVYAENQVSVTAGGNASNTVPSAATRTPLATTAGGAATGTRLNVGRRQPAATPAATAANPTDGRLASGTQTTPGATAPPKANAVVPKSATVRKGLMSALNEYQRKLVAEGRQQFADEYDVEFMLDVLANAKIVDIGKVNKGNTSMATPSTAAGNKLGSKQSMDPNSQVKGAVAGTQIVQFLDLALRNSSYIRDQQTVVIDTNGIESNRPTNLRNTAWFKIGFEAVAKLDQWDEKRNDYAYKIKYTIAPYKIVQLVSPYFRPPTYNGVHKRYRYWYTGQNTEVLSYEETLNNLYSIVMTHQNTNAALIGVNELLKFTSKNSSGQALQGSPGRVNEPAANAADQLYSPSNLKEATVQILGDPAWLQQGEAWVALPKGSPFYYNAFLPDGTINFDSQQILFEIGFNTPQDYNIATGLQEPDRGDNRVIATIDEELKRIGTTKISRTYIAKEVTSNFAKGKFTQTLKGVLMLYYTNPAPNEGRIVPAATNAAAVGAKPTIAVKAPVPNPNTLSGPATSISQGVQQILRPATQLNNPTLTQLQASPVYIQARRNGATPAAALEAARAAFAAGTNSAANFALPGIRTGLPPAPSSPQLIVKDE